jgi:hypothetical protein
MEATLATFRYIESDALLFEIYFRYRSNDIEWKHKHNDNGANFASPSFWKS